MIFLCRFSARPPAIRQTAGALVTPRPGAGPAGSAGTASSASPAGSGGAAGFRAAARVPRQRGSRRRHGIRRRYGIRQWRGFHPWRGSSRQRGFRRRRGWRATASRVRAAQPAGRSVDLDGQPRCPSGCSFWQLISCQNSVIMLGARCRRGRAAGLSGQAGRNGHAGTVRTPADSRVRTLRPAPNPSPAARQGRGRAECARGRGNSPLGFERQL
jgi:hypothetical protein